MVYTRITDVTSAGIGWGVSEPSSGAVVVPFTLPGDIVEPLESSDTPAGPSPTPHHRLVEPSPHRQTAPCSAFPSCSGCTFMHANPQWQITFKEELLRTLLGDTAREATWEKPLQAETLAYRRKARLRARWDQKSGTEFIGFKNRFGRYIADVERCEVLAPPFDSLITPLRTLIGSLSARNAIPQLELSVGENAAALILRHLAPLDPSDVEKLTTFAYDTGIRFFLQSGGPDSLAPLTPTSNDPLTYSLPRFNLTFHFEPLDFIQAHRSLNEILVATAIDWMAPRPDETILDLFCGLGNFSLPLAQRAKTVIGVEGSATMTERAAANAALNTISNAHFFAADLEKDSSTAPWAQRHYDGILLDPPRSGASAIIPQIVTTTPSRIVYVSCNPATFARDAALLRDLGYPLIRVCVADMFPHTEHVEAVGLFGHNGACQQF